MNCTRSQRLLYLHREGELTAEESRMLATHVAGCRQCRELQKRLADELVLVEKARHMALVPEDPEALTRRILSNVDAMSNVREVSRTPVIAERVLDFLVSPRFRLAASFSIVLLVGMFLKEFYTVAGDVRQLELRQVAQEQPRPAVSVAYAVDLRSLHGAREGSLVAGLESHTQGEFLVVNEREVAACIASGRSIQHTLAKPPYFAGDAETLSTLVTYFRNNAHPQISFSMEGV
jgi:hypothetical protein